MKKCLLCDKLILEGWFENEAQILPWILAGQILVNNEQIHSMKEQVPIDAVIRIKQYYKKRFVNKGGLKLQGAIDELNVDVKDKIALDCGASTGGFTDCLLVNGAKSVYAVDVGFGQLAAKLLNDARVISMEKTNLSDSSLIDLAPKPELATLDLSYLSLKKAVVTCKNILCSNGKILALIKPIFEVDSKKIRQTGEINNPDVHKKIINELFDFFTNNSFIINGFTNSSVKGNGGTIEYFVYLSLKKDPLPVTLNHAERDFFNDIQKINDIDEVIKKAFELKDFDKNAFSSPPEQL
ncbi:MAG: TlyA family RNA methyltransferase [Clostridia bacterium]